MLCFLYVSSYIIILMLLVLATYSRSTARKVPLYISPRTLSRKYFISISVDSHSSFLSSPFLHCRIIEILLLISFDILH